MSTLQNIRNRSGLLLAVIGSGLVLFLFSDIIGSGFDMGESSAYVGEVLGEDISRQDYELKVEERIKYWKSDPQNQGGELTQTITAALRSQVWDQHVRELVMNNEYSKLGIVVSDNEWKERISGANANVRPEISKEPAFQNPETGQFDGNEVIRYLNNIDRDSTGEAKAQWLGFQKQLIDIIKTSKYNLLVAKAMYVTNQEAKVNFNEKSQNVTFNYVAIPLTSVADSAVEPTENEIKTYYKKHKANYEQDASRDVDFVVFSVVPSTEDDAITKSSIEDLKADFAIDENYDLMARRNSDNTAARFTFATKEELQDPNWTELFTTQEGTVIGPYQVSQAVYRIAKLVIAQNRPDSVEARHILIKPTQTMNWDSVQARIVAIKAQVEAGADFGILAQNNSEDKGSKNKGGDLDWFSESATANKFKINPLFTDTFNEACFASKIGDLSVVPSPLGIHLIEVTKTSKAVRKVKIAFIDRNVEPSTETFNTYEDQAVQFAAKILNEGIAFDSLVADQNLVKRSDSKVTPDKQNIVGLPNSRKMVQWMNTAEQGAVSYKFPFENQYVVAYLKKIYIQGFTPLEDVKEQISALVLKEKKAAHISANIKAADLATIAANHGQTTVSAQRANLANLSLQGIGYEPDLVGSIFATNIGAISKPIEGKNAVYVIEVTTKDDAKNIDDFIQIKQEIQKGAAAYVNGAAYKVLKTEADVKDNLSDIY